MIDRVRYPIDDLDGAVATSVINDARRQIADIGAAELAGFVTPEGVAALVADAASLAERAHWSGGVGTAYLELPGDQWAPDHPRQRWMAYSVGAVGYDVIPLASPLRQIYELEAVPRFIQRVLDRGTLFHYADPCGALNLAVMREGDELQWHYDQTDFVVSLAVQPADVGGDFDVVPRIRDGADEHYDRVGALLDGDESDVLTLAMTPGTLLIFEGRHSIHRVSPVSGPATRYVGLLAYDTQPTTVSSELLREVRYGRATPFDSPPVTWPSS